MADSPDLRAERDRYREALHTIAGLSHQDVDEPFGRLLARVHKVARDAVEPVSVDPELTRLNDQIAAAEQAYDQALAHPTCEGLNRAGAVLARLYARKRELTTVKEPA